ncbi:MAG: tripartite tricarboxylate transporter substrate binding protein, partial [Burkholderiales bacterium]|nr:tripartite tricarboxylate transporter substrate binding protein [Burkholderiales bacterium]
DLRAVTLVVMAPYLLIVNPKVPVNSVSDLVRLAKGSPGKLSYASPGIGSSVHLTGELFQIMAGVNLVHIPYKGAGAALADVVAGRVEMMFSAIPGVIPFIRSGRLKGLAVTSAARSVGLPDVPTIGESGVPGFDMSGWYGLVAPRATPAAIVRALNKSVNEAMAAGEIHAQFVAMGLDPVGGSAEEFSAFIRKELDKYARLVRSANIPLQ